MGLFGRKPAEPQMGILIDMNEYQAEIADGSRPGLPHDGRYWVALIETNGRIARLIWEQAATYHGAKNHLRDFERTYGKKPKLATSVRVDDIAGIWFVEPRGRPDAVLSVTHPVELRYPPYREQPGDRISGYQQLKHSIDSGGLESVLARRRSQIYQIVQPRRVEHGSYDPEVMQRHILYLKSLAGTMERRGRDLTSFRELMSQAESYLKRGPQFSGEAHRYGYSAMFSLNDARAAGGGGSAICTLTPARNYARDWYQCDTCGNFNAELKFCDDFLCVDCFAGEVASILMAEAYWVAPNDRAYVSLDYEEARQRGYRDAERILGEP